MITRSRRRRLALLLLSALLCGLAGTVFYLARGTPVQRLQPYLGKDLRTLSEKEQIKFDGLIACLAPKARAFIRLPLPRSRDPGAWRAYLSGERFALFRRSWYLWQVPDREGQDRLVLFQGQPLWSIPGSSSARIFVFDAEGRLLTDCEFQTGYRITIDDARWLGDNGHGFPCLFVCSRPSIHGHDVISQYYAFLDDTFALVRLEDSDGKLVPVNYYNLEHTIGPRVPERTAPQWEAALRSQDCGEILRTLVWLGGDHILQPLCDEDTGLERCDEAARALGTRARPGVCSAVDALPRSEDPWIREAAQRASEAMRDGDR